MNEIDSYKAVNLISDCVKRISLTSSNVSTSFSEGQDEINIAVDVLWNGGPKNNQMAIEVFQRKEKADNIEIFLKPMLQFKGFSWNPDKSRYTYYFDGTGIEQEDFNLMDEKFKSVVTFIDETITS